MPPLTHINVTAPEGRVTPIHHTDGASPGGGQLRVTSDVVARVRWLGSQNIRRAIKSGDLIMCDMNGAHVPSAEAAAAPAEHADGPVRPIQRRAKAEVVK